MIVTKAALSRRTFLRGAGFTLALPLLDSMVPALSALAQTPARPVRRLGFVYIPMGADVNTKVWATRWTPQQEGRISQLSPSLDSLTPFLDQVTVFTNLEIRNGYTTGNHAAANSSFLSCARAKRTEGSDYELGITVDQIAATHMGQDTPIPSLELGVDLLAQVGSCDNGYACAYMNSLSWTSPTTPLPTEADPRRVFERLFGDGGNSQQRRNELRKNGSILDWMRSDMARLQRDLGQGDRRKVDQYVDSVREVERRIQKAELQTADSPLPDFERPNNVPASWEEHVKLMMDLQVLAQQADLTRVMTFQVAREASTRSYPQIGVSEPHHPVSHHVNDLEKLAMLAKINAYHVSLFAYYLDKLQSTPDGDGSLLDHSINLCGSGLGNPDIHDHSNMPIVVVGGGARGFKGARHIKFPEYTPLANLYLSLLDKFGIHLDSFVDSTGRVEDWMV